ncbi:hypothetical protein TELCIR_17368 [Teladorsagia circumcincta]|uniref:HEAT repeat protein n=1 Tax=Teladorsagia circumcincta TaxID=45464 RepID=A0A2G9TT58_TELCI|nr:hypothetical protein TELCIR_17368 [Teladorsagia circumcincta]
MLAYSSTDAVVSIVNQGLILAVDPSVQSELFKENGDEPARFESTNRAKPVQLRYHFFVTILNDPDTLPRQKIVVAFVLATLFHNNYRIAQENLTKKGYVNLCTELLSENQAKDCRLLKLWILIGLGRLWADYDPARWQAVRLVAYAKVLKELDDNAPEVRAAAVYALGCLVKNRSETNEHAATIDQEICDDLCNKCTKDGSVLVREQDESQPCTEDVRDRARSWRLRRERAKKQLAYLENKNFKEPLERTWIHKVETAIPHTDTTFDEIPEVDGAANLGRSSENEGGGVRFMIGSPVTAGSALVPPEGNMNANSLSSNADIVCASPSGMFDHQGPSSKPSAATLQRPSRQPNQRKLSMPTRFPPPGRGGLRFLFCYLLFSP